MPSLQFRANNRVYTIPLQTTFIRNSPYQIGVLINGKAYYARVTPLAYNHCPHLKFRCNSVDFYFATSIKDYNNNDAVVGQYNSSGILDGNWFYFYYHNYPPKALVDRNNELNNENENMGEIYLWIDNTLPKTLEEFKAVGQYNYLFEIYSASTLFKYSYLQWTSGGNFVFNNPAFTIKIWKNFCDTIYENLFQTKAFSGIMGKDSSSTDTVTWAGYYTKKDLYYNYSEQVTATFTNRVDTGSRIYECWNAIVGAKHSTFQPIKTGAMPVHFDSQSWYFWLPEAGRLSWDTYNPQLYNTAKLMQTLK